LHHPKFVPPTGSDGTENDKHEKAFAAPVWNAAQDAVRWP